MHICQDERVLAKIKESGDEFTMSDFSWEPQKATSDLTDLTTIMGNPAPHSHKKSLACLSFLLHKYFL